MYRTPSLWTMRSTLALLQIWWRPSRPIKLAIFPARNASRMLAARERGRIEAEESMERVDLL
jgi:hypothetical protein